jgi:two-component system nitrogen regulation response regulator GlnG
MAVLVRHRWPGNVRELENVIYRSAVIAQGDAILVKDLPVEIRGTEGAEPVPVAAEAAPAVPARPTLTQALDLVFEQLKTSDEPVMARIEREMITRALAGEGGDEAKAAKLLGLTRAAMQKRSKET